MILLDKFVWDSFTFNLVPKLELGPAYCFQVSINLNLLIHMPLKIRIVKESGETQVLINFPKKVNKSQKPL
jgi:hypothetical protein